MPYLATLTIDDGKFNITKCNYGFKLSIDETGRIITNPKYDLIKIEVDTINLDNTSLYDWLSTPNMKKDGVFTFYKDKNNMPFKKVIFFNALCIKYDEYFEQGSNHMKINITISPAKVVEEKILKISLN